MTVHIKLLIFLILFISANISAQDRLTPYHQGRNYWHYAVKEVPFEKAEFPFVMKQNGEAKIGSYIAFPVEYVEGNVFMAKIKMNVEEGSPDIGPDKSNSYEKERGRTDISLTLQNPKTSIASGFCASSRKLKISKETVETLSLSDAKKRPKKFYLIIHVPYWVGKVTILHVELTGYKFIEKEFPNEEEKVEIRNLIKQLAAESFDERQTADNKLCEIGEKAHSILKEFTKDKDPERRGRVKEILAKIEKKLSKKYPPVKIIK